MKHRIAVIILAEILLTSCRIQPDVPTTVPSGIETVQTVPQATESTSESRKTESEAPETAVPETAAQTAAQPETEPETAEPPETELQPLNLPDSVTTNIVNPDAEPILAEIAHTFAEYPDAAAYFSDVNGKFCFGINEDVKFHSASTIKAPYCLYLLNSGSDPETKIPFTVSSRTSASGKLTSSAVGQSFTVRELIGYTIRDSDNQAYKLLYDTFGTEDYNAFVTSAGIPGLALSGESEWAQVTARELSAAMALIYHTSEDLAEELRNASFNAQIASGTAYETAHKYGYNGGADGYHDTAIVYAPGTAYVLTVMTYNEFSAGKDPNALFRTAAALCDELHGVLSGQ